jgi:hypothetical protein
VDTLPPLPRYTTNNSRMTSITKEPRKREGNRSGIQVNEEEQGKGSLQDHDTSNVRRKKRSGGQKQQRKSKRSKANSHEASGREDGSRRREKVVRASRRLGEKDKGGGGETLTVCPSAVQAQVGATTKNTIRSDRITRGRVMVSETEEGSGTAREVVGPAEEEILMGDDPEYSITNPPSSITMGSGLHHVSSTESPENLNFLEMWVRDTMFKKVKIINCDEMLSFHGPIKKLFQRSYPRLCQTAVQWCYYKFNINKKCNEKRNNVINNLKTKFMSKCEATKGSGRGLIRNSRPQHLTTDIVLFLFRIELNLQKV